MQLPKKGIMITIRQAGTDDPFVLLDAILPPQKPTMPISEEEWQKKMPHPA